MEDQFPCQYAQGNPLCISELQFCDGVSDCGDDSDEPSDCSDGMLLHCLHYTSCTCVVLELCSSKRQTGSNLYSMYTTCHSQICLHID